MHARLTGWPYAALLLVTVAALAGCSTPPPTAELRSARDAIARAEYDGAAHFAAQPFQQAQTKLSSANASVSNKDMDKAKDLAEESAADADYADAVSLSQKAAQSSEQLQQYQQQRRSGSTQPTQ